MPASHVDAPIGIFDSGFGGLTVARSVIDQLPHESVRYLGDTARQPYGPKPIGEVREYALECLDHLYAEGVKALVIACNSASAAMLRDARERYDVPVVEVIYPATRRAVAASRSGRIGVICTRATAESMAYEDAFAAAPQVELTTRACPRFVDFVEDGVTGGDDLIAVAHEYLDPLTAAGVDTLILGCTHYPLLTGVISYVMGDAVTLVSSAEECAKDVYKMLVSTGLMRPGGDPAYHFATTGAPEEFERIGRRFLGAELMAADPVRRWPRMRLTVVGCSGSYPGPDSPASCYLLEQDDPDGRTWRVLLDLGSGALGALHHYADPLTIDAVALSHLHPDHCLDLCGFYVLRKYHPSGQQPRLPVYGPGGTGERMTRAYDLPDGVGMGQEFDFRAYTERTHRRPLHDRGDPGPAPRRGVRPASHRWWVDPGLHRGHGALRGARPARHRRGPAAGGGVLPRR